MMTAFLFGFTGFLVCALIFFGLLLLQPTEIKESDSDNDDSEEPFTGTTVMSMEIQLPMFIEKISCNPESYTAHCPVLKVTTLGPSPGAVGDSLLEECSKEVTKILANEERSSNLN